METKTDGDPRDQTCAQPDHANDHACILVWIGDYPPFCSVCGEMSEDLPTPEDALICPDCGEPGEHDYCGRERFKPSYTSAFGSDIEPIE